MIDTSTLSLRSEKVGNHPKHTFPDKATSDWVGPRDPDSNMRLIRFHMSPTETALEKEYRLMREDTQNWHHEFWSKHNQNFFKQKHEFIKQRQQENAKHRDDDKTDDDTVSAEELSLFYEQFLDDNYELHRNYNREWYRRNFSLLWLATKVDFCRLIKWRWKSRTSW